jgi:hypothetical protein
VANDRASSAAPAEAPADTAQTVPASPAKPRARAKQPAATARRRVAVAGSASAAQASAAAVEVTAPQDLASACATPAVAEPTHDEIATRAYFIYLRRGTPGNPDQDWQQAVWELRQEQALA